jgi:MATE family multidrug resistance protein
MQQQIFVKKEIYPLLRLAMPLIMTGLMQSLVWFFETVFLARLGTETLAAGALVSWLFGTLSVILFGTLSSVNILVAHRYGANDHPAIALIVRDAFLLALLLVVPTFLLFWNMSPVFLLFGQSPAIVALSQSYLHALAFGILPDFLLIVLIEFIVGLGHTRIIMFFTVVEVGFSIFFSYVLILGRFGFPAMGITGAGWGITMSYWLSALILFLYVLSDKAYKKYFQDLLKLQRISYMVELIKIGLPMGLMFFIEVGFFFALTLMAGTFGSQSMAANQIALQYLCLFMAVIFAIAQAVTVRMGHLLGAKEKPAAARACYLGIFISGVLMFLVAFVSWVYPEVLIAADFNVSDARHVLLIQDIKAFLMVSAIFQIFEGIRITLFGALRSLKDTQFTLGTSVVSFWFIALPVGYLLASKSFLGAPGLWWGMVLGAAISTILLAFRFRAKIRHWA